jgi:hypothetical protein
MFAGDSVFAKKVCKAFLVYWGIFFTCLFSLVLSIVFELMIGSYAHYDPGLLDVSLEGCEEEYRGFRPMVSDNLSSSRMWSAFMHSRYGTV